MTDIVNEKGAQTLSTSGSARVNLFFKLTRDAYKNPNFYKLIDDSICENTLDTLKIIFHGRDCRNGKGDRQTFIKAMRHIYNVNPDIWIENIRHVPFYGRYCDWFEILDDLDSVQSYFYYEARNIIVDLVCKQLDIDLECMYNGEFVSLLAKWIPSEHKKWNKHTKILKYICIKLYNTDKVLPYHYKALRTDYLTPLRKYINILENYMCSGRWDEIDFSTIPSVAMLKFKKSFPKHTPDTYIHWLNSVKNGKSKINANQVYPHDLVRTYINLSNLDDVVELQWNEIVKKTKDLGIFENSIVLSDVSGSMNGTPMEVSIALGILISGLTSEPFKNTIITFHENPTLHIIPEELTTLKDKVNNIMKMQWGGATNLYKIFKLILERAKQLNLKEEDMPKRLYILSDMQFDMATGNMTNMEYIEEKYTESGYNLPQIIFWNLRSDTTTDYPIQYNKNNTALISGYSPSILKSILNITDFNPYTIMRNTIDDYRYDRIKI